METGTDLLRWNSRLPENYGEGQRQYDMHSAALKAAAPFVWLTSLLSALAAAMLLHHPAALILAVPVYFCSIWPLKRSLKQASDEWDKERLAWNRQFE